MTKIAIVEDEEEEFELVRGYVGRYSAENEEEFDIVHFTDAVAFLENYSADYDIVFMDIQLPHVNGLAASIKLRAIDPTVILIFITNMSQYAVRGYDADAMAFMVKPVSYADFEVKLRRALVKLRMMREGKVLLSTEEGVRVLSAARIYFVEVMNHRVTYHTVDGEVSAYGSLKQAETELSSCGFVRCNACYLVNLRYVTAVNGYTVDVGGQTLQVSYSRKKGLLMAMADWLGGKL